MCHTICCCVLMPLHLDQHQLAVDATGILCWQSCAFYWCTGCFTWQGLTTSRASSRCWTWQIMSRLFCSSWGGRAQASSLLLEQAMAALQPMRMCSAALLMIILTVLMMPKAAAVPIYAAANTALQAAAAKAEALQGKNYSSSALCYCTAFSMLPQAPFGASAAGHQM